MTLDQLVMYVAACESGSFSQAAKRTYATRQAISKAVMALENELGVVLLERTAIGVKPTDAGQAVLSQAHIMLQARDRILSEKGGRGRLEETLNVGCAYGVVGKLGPTLFSKFQEENPHLHLTFGDESDATVEKKTLEGAYDLCFAVEPVDRTKFAVFPVFSEVVYLQVYAGHPLFDKPEITVDDLRSCRFVQPGIQQKAHAAFLDWFEEVGISPNFIDTKGISEFSTLENFALLEKALFIAPESIACIDRPHVRTLAMPRGSLGWDASIAIPRGREITPGMSALIEFFADEASSKWEGADLSEE